MDNPNCFLDEYLLIKRPCLTVGDLSKSLSIYRDILGFQLIYQSKADSNSYLYSVFNLPQSASLTFAALSTKDNPRALALTEVKGVELSSSPLTYSCALVIQVSALTKKIEQLEQLNLFIAPPNHFTTENNLSFTEQAFCDYDGHRIMLYEQKPE
ncbi:hypothetical protein GM3708_1479 [Geminocystis sp. NIES-3708]|uniref:VOC family protein n=1 Tax=Geminocystis sp. NIES-3708 TaxID=1615909 RepID=UPI0005FC79ED|nr:VOC family protein [Geminocystis sp. NIES-3708]BAQ61073.1 hypothetical protein GM3708_1479 [Geminocystis sp. NIES-3708]